MVLFIEELMKGMARELVNPDKVTLAGMKLMALLPKLFSAQVMLAQVMFFLVLHRTVLPHRTVTTGVNPSSYRPMRSIYFYNANLCFF